MKQFLTTWVLISLLYTPLYALHAETKSIDELSGELAALRGYIERTSLQKQPITADELRASIALGTEWFANAQEPSGHFKYEYAPFSGTYQNGDNMVRQTGALYALGAILASDPNDPLQIEETIERAINFIFSRTIREEIDEKTIACVTQREESRTCPLGATSLALIGIIDYVEANPQKKRTFEDDIHAYASFILHLQKENNGFRNLHRVGSKNQDDAESPFSNGEALLALARYYAYSENNEAKDAVQSVFEYLKAQPYDANLYLWIMAAVVNMEAFTQPDVYRTYTKNFTDWRIARALHSKNIYRNYCAYAEGLSSALTVLRGNVSHAEEVRYQNELDRLNANHLGLQITEADATRLLWEGGVPVLRTISDMERARGGFLTSDAEPMQRIDFTQHCLSAYLQTLRDLHQEELL